MVTPASAIGGSCLVRSLPASEAPILAPVRDEDPRPELARSRRDRRVTRARGSLEEGFGRAARRTDLAPIVQTDEPNARPSEWIEATKARARLGRAPAFTLHDGRKRTVEW